MRNKQTNKSENTLVKMIQNLLLVIYMSLFFRFSLLSSPAKATLPDTNTVTQVYKSSEITNILEDSEAITSEKETTEPEVVFENQEEERKFEVKNFVTSTDKELRQKARQVKKRTIQELKNARPLTLHEVQTIVKNN